jgi:Tfp pilus assembly protein PilV
MLPHTPPVARDPSPGKRFPSAERAGLSLLEVLVACGLLVVGLSSVAALLPAATSRFADAVAEDRAAQLAINAHAEIEARGVLRASFFAAAPSMALVLGESQSLLTTSATATDAGKNARATLLLGPLGDAAVSGSSSRFTMASSGTTRFDTEAIWPATGWQSKDPAASALRRGFFSEDDLDFPVVGGAPQSGFETAPGNGTTLLATRLLRRGVCWSALVIPNASGTPAPGTTASVAIMTFKKPPTVLPIDLEADPSGVYFLPSGRNNDRRTFLKACSHVLALPSSAALRPKLFRVNASWAAESKSYVSFDAPPDDVKQFITAKFLPVLGFSGLIRVDEFPVVLE